METVKYSASVCTPAGWRHVVMTATVERISAKRVKVVAVTHIDDECIRYNMSRTGANRQKYNGVYFAEKEKGKVKNISA
jgi:hypothetical protein